MTTQYWQLMCTFWLFMRAAAGGEVVSSKEIAAQIRSVAPYLKPQGGGVTCSGGEPLLQPDFVSAIFQEAHAMGLTTCLDTTGQGSKHHHWWVHIWDLNSQCGSGQQLHAGAWNAWQLGMATGISLLRVRCCIACCINGRLGMLASINVFVCV
jgi:hypothetical protein